MSSHRSTGVVSKAVVATRLKAKEYQAALPDVVSKPAAELTELTDVRHLEGEGEGVCTFYLRNTIPAFIKICMWKGKPYCLYFIGKEAFAVQQRFSSDLYKKGVVLCGEITQNMKTIVLHGVAGGTVRQLCDIMHTKYVPDSYLDPYTLVVKPIVAYHHIDSLWRKRHDYPYKASITGLIFNNKYVIYDMWNPEKLPPIPFRSVRATRTPLIGVGAEEEGGGEGEERGGRKERGGGEERGEGEKPCPSTAGKVRLRLVATGLPDVYHVQTLDGGKKLGFAHVGSLANSMLLRREVGKSGSVVCHCVRNTKFNKWEPVAVEG